MTPRQEHTAQLIAVVQSEGFRIEAPPRVPPSSFRSTPGPKQGVDYRSPYWPARKHTVQPLSLKAQGLKVENGMLAPVRKEDSLMIVAPVTPRPRAYLDDGERRKAAYRARKEAGLCQRCPQPARIKRNGTRGVYCERCAGKKKGAA